MGKGGCERMSLGKKKCVTKSTSLLSKMKKPFCTVCVIESSVIHIAKF